MEIKPNLRFNGFNTAWEQHILSDVATFSKGQGYSKKDLVTKGDPIILYGQLYTNYQTVINDVDTFVRKTKNSIYTTGKEVIIPASGETAEDISRASAITKPEIIVGGDLNIIYPKSTINPIFLALTMSNGNQKKILSQKAQGKTIVHLHNDDLKDVLVRYPMYEEQSKISQLFSNLDSLISVQKNIYDELQNVKKSLLQKMFPEGNEDKPKIRFKGFTNAWEQRYFKDTYNQASEGGTPNTNIKSFYENGKIPFVKIEDTTQKYICKTSSYITEEGLNHSSAWLVPEGSVIFTNGATIGNVAISTIPVATKQGIVGIITTKNINNEFLYYSLSGPNFQREVGKKQAVGTFATIILRELNTITLSIPTFEEQDKISTLLASLDSLITLHQRK